MRACGNVLKAPSRKTYFSFVAMHKNNFSRGRLRILIRFFLTCECALASVVFPTVASTDLLSSVNDTISIYAQTSRSYAPYHAICTSQSLVRVANHVRISIEKVYCLVNSISHVCFVFSYSLALY